MTDERTELVNKTAEEVQDLFMKNKLTLGEVFMVIDHIKHELIHKLKDEGVKKDG